MSYTYEKMEAAHNGFNTTHRIHRNNRITSNISIYYYKKMQLRNVAK